MNIRCSQDDELWQAVIAGRDKHLAGSFILDDSKPAAIIMSGRYEELRHGEGFVFPLAQRLMGKGNA